MKTFKNLCIITLSILLFTACEKPYDTFKLDDLDKHPVYFQFDYFNLAWGYNHHGFFIDNEGQVMKYQHPMADSTLFWTRILPDSLISKSELMENYEHATELLTTVDIEDLLKQVNRIPDAALGNLSEPKSESFDGGTFSLYAYIWKEDNDKYKRILLETKGDWAQKNESSEAIKIVDWMKDVGDDAYNGNDWFGW